MKKCLLVLEDYSLAAPEVRPEVWADPYFMPITRAVGSLRELVSRKISAKNAAKSLRKAGRELEQLERL